MNGFGPLLGGAELGAGVVGVEGVVGSFLADGKRVGSDNFLARDPGIG